MTVTEKIDEEYREWQMGNIISLNAPTGSGKKRLYWKNFCHMS